MEYETQEHELTAGEIKELLIPLNYDLSWEPNYDQDFFWSGNDNVIVPKNWLNDE